MHIVHARNVNEAYFQGLTLLQQHGVKESSRAGDVLVMPCPVTTMYEQPTERVLFNPIRDANPFFHLMESLWMLAGRNDAKWLDRFVGDFSKRFAQENGIQHGAYGYRWRQHFSLFPSVDFDNAADQLKICIDLLQANPGDRRVVLQMWDPEIDLGGEAKDIPCNLCVLPRIVNGKLDITVFCRSNDAVWGAYGANAVHFSILQEYLAGKLGVKVGTYYQISNNFHAYLNTMPKDPTLGFQNYYDEDFLRPTIVVPLFDPDFPREIELFDKEVARFVEEAGTDTIPYANHFLRVVAKPMLAAHTAYKAKSWNDAFKQLDNMPHRCDWQIAAGQWLSRRHEKATGTMEK